MLPLRIFSWGTYLPRGNFGINSSKMLHEVNKTDRVAPLVIIPCNKLDKIWVEHDTRTKIKYGRTVFTLKVSEHKGFITVSKESLHGALRLLLDNSTDIFVGVLFAKLAGKVDKIYINSGDTESHACDLALHRRDNICHRLCSSSRRGGDVARGSTSNTPVLEGGIVNMEHEVDLVFTLEVTEAIVTARRQMKSNNNSGYLLHSLCKCTLTLTLTLTLT